MQKIKQLPPHEAQKIAAGEVVERPTNLIKELIENALDAGADKISIWVEQAGKQRIRIVDNGCGMSAQDARICFYPHATSKITSIHDLSSISSFGFRGEALASITAVAKVTLITKEADTDQGIKLTIANHAITSEEPIGCNTGTDICVDDLFYNVPARKKFLKKDETEWRHITQLFQALSLAHRTVHFTLYRQNSVAYNCPPTDSIKERIAQLWSSNLYNHTVQVEAKHEPGSLTLTGAITDHQYTRFDRNAIFLFVNNRWVKNYQLSRALLKGYMNVLPGGKFPAAALFLTVPTESVDVNIHPRKEEVQLLHPVRVSRFVQETIKKSLENNLSVQLNQSVKLATPQAQYNSPFAAPTASQILSESFSHDFSLPAPFGPTPSQRAPQAAKSIAGPVFAQQAVVSADAGDAGRQSFNGTIIGHAHKTYILIQQADGIYFVDQHAAHERILYEIFRNRFDEVAQVQLAFPQTIQMTESELDALTGHLELFTSNGIALERFGPTQLIVKATPVHIKDINLQELVVQVSSWIESDSTHQSDDVTKQLNERLHAQMACKAAIKAGDSLTHEQMRQLLTDLSQTDNRFTCPHGRPTGWLLGLYEIEKKFKRKK